MMLKLEIVRVLGCHEDEMGLVGLSQTAFRGQAFFRRVCFGI